MSGSMVIITSDGDAMKFAPFSTPPELQRQIHSKRSLAEESSSPLSPPPSPPSPPQFQKRQRNSASYVSIRKEVNRVETGNGNGFAQHAGVDLGEDDAWEFSPESLPIPSGHFQEHGESSVVSPCTAAIASVTFNEASTAVPNKKKKKRNAKMQMTNTKKLVQEEEEEEEEVERAGNSAHQVLSVAEDGPIPRRSQRRAAVVSPTSLLPTPTPIPTPTPPLAPDRAPNAANARNVLALGMVFSNDAVRPSRGQKYRDRVRCTALEELGYTVKTLDNKHSDSNLPRHLNSSYDRACKDLVQRWPDLTFDLVILDYFFSMDGWAKERWGTLISKSLSQLAQSSTLAPRCEVWLPYLQFVEGQILQHRQELEKVFHIRYCCNGSENPLFVASDMADDALRLCKEPLVNENQVRQLLWSGNTHKRLFVVLTKRLLE